MKLYSGGEYWLYRYKKYTDVRLVFAVEEATGFFGGDYDNFTYPRYDLDVAFFRAYENGLPAKTEYLAWSAKGADENELVLAIGSPGTTSRLLTMAQLDFHREVANPTQMDVLPGPARCARELRPHGRRSGAARLAPPRAASRTR